MHHEAARLTLTRRATLRTLCRITLRNDFPPDLTLYFTLTEKAAVIYDRDRGLAEMLLEMKAEE